MEERSPLLRHQNMCLARHNYRLPLIRSKAAIAILLWDGMINVYQHMMTTVVIFVVYQHNHKFFSILDNSISAVIALPMLLCPIGGLIADTWTGRYQMIVISIYTCFVAWIVCAITYILWYYLQNDNIITIVLLIATCLFLFGFGGFQSISVPFNVDQLIGASTDEISTVINWHVFLYFMAKVISPFVLIYTQSSIQALVSVGIAGLIIIVVIITHCFLKAHLERIRETSNPIKLIYSVLNYAMHAKYPRSRSALTYWENNYPSRIDFGKNRFGGPFTEEQVENVKTVFRIIPVISSMIACQIGYDTVNLYQRSADRNFWHVNLYELNIEQDYYSYFVVILLILVYQFLVHPCLSKYIPSMLKRIGLGLLFAFLTSASYLTIAVVNEHEKSLAECPLGLYTLYNSTIILPLDYKWLLIPETLFGISQFLLFTASLEFTVAQSPKSMRGLTIGLWYAALGISNLISGYSLLLYFYIGIKSLGCLIYYYMGNTLFVLLVFIGFLITAKCYKHRIRDYTIPVYQIAEEHTEKYLDSRDSTLSA